MRQIGCPRCGYDQRGVMARWLEQCPLEGACAECGLHFKWAELLHPEKFEPRWCVEFVHRPSSIPLAGPATLWKSFSPWRFWSSLRMAYPIRRRRLLAYLALLLLPLLLCYLLAQSVATWRAYSQFMQQANVLAAGPANQQATIQQAIAQYQAQLAMYEGIGADHLRRTYNMSEQEWRDWTEAPAAELKKEIAQLQQQLQGAKTAKAAPPTIPIFQEWLKAIVLPCSRAPGPSLMLPGGTAQYPSPDELYAFINGAQGSTGGPFGFALGFFMNWSAWIFWSTLLLVPACFVLLPVSRRRAKVRWVHIGRVLAYSAFLPVTISCAGILLFVASPGGALPGFALFLTTWGITVSLFIWWAAAIDRYLQIPHAWQVSGLLCVLSMLLALTVGFYLKNPMTPAEMWTWTIRAFSG
ncbi:MAG: hypothetical protein L0Y44_06605 [Phycisphaerales bacterium]|nr:hypothetical protein [Phycisphaerales bacterium]